MSLAVTRTTEDMDVLLSVIIIFDDLKFYHTKIIDLLPYTTTPFHPLCR